MKNVLTLTPFVACVSAVVVLSPGLTAATFYTTGSSSFPTTGSAWNTQSDGTGSSGSSGTYNAGTNDLVFQAGDSMFTARNTTAFAYNALSYMLDGGILDNGTNSNNSIGTFSGGDITVTANGGIFRHATNGGIGVPSGGIGGSANLQLGANTVSFGNSSSGNSGIYDFGLNIVGAGTFDFVFTPSGITWYFSNLSSDFTGTLLGDTFSGILRLAPGNGASNTSVIIGDTNPARTGRLDLMGDFSVGSLTLETENIANGIYTYSDLITLNPNYADHLIDNGGTVYVGVAIPEPSTSVAAVGGLFIVLLSARRRCRK